MVKRTAISALSAYLKRRPDELVRFLKNAVGFRFGVPLDVFRWLAGQATGKKAPRDIQIESAPPGLRLAASLDAMGTPLRVSGVIFIERVEFSSETFQIELRLSELALEVLDESVDTPIAALIRSGALDLSRPGNLAAFMPKRPAVLVEAKDDRIVLDLMKHPKFARHPQIGRVLGVISPLVAVRSVASETEHFDVLLEPFPNGLTNGVGSVRSAI